MNNAVKIDVLSTSIPVSVLKLRTAGLTGPQLNRLRHELFKHPSVAIIDCTIFANDTGISDQVLSHQLTLVPVYLDPDFVLAYQDKHRTVPNTSANTLVFTVTVDCPLATSTPSHPTEPDATDGVDDAAETVHVFARDLRFHPVGEQLSWTASQRTIAPIMVMEPDMHLMTLRARGKNSFHAEIKACMGTASEHTKFTDVLQCWFRPEPIIALQRPIRGREAQLLVHLCKKAVFRIDRSGGAAAPDTGSDASSSSSSSSNRRPAVGTVRNHTLSDDAADARDRLESDTYYEAFKNEQSYSLINTLVPLVRDGVAHTPDAAATTPNGAGATAMVDDGMIKVVQPENCDQCGACQSSELCDMEDMSLIPSAVHMSFSPTRYIFYLHCRAKHTAVQMLLRTLATMKDACYAQLAQQVHQAFAHA